MSNTFTRSDYTAAVKKMRTLDLTSIDEVIDSGIPLDVNEYALPQWSKKDALGLLMQTTSWEFGYRKNKNYKKKTYEEYLSDVEKAIFHVINRMEVISVTFDFVSDLINQPFSNALILLLERGLDIDTKDKKTGKTLKELLEEKALSAVDEYLKSNKQIASKTVKIKNPNKLSEMTLDKLQKLLHKYLVGLESDIEFLLAHSSKTIYDNKKSLDKFDEQYDDIVWTGYVSDEAKDATFSLLLECLKEEISAGKLPKDRLIENAYHMLHKVKLGIPLKQLEIIALDNDKVPSREEAFAENIEREWWETVAENHDPRVFTINLTEKEDIENVLRHLLDKFDDYLLYWRYAADFNSLLFIDTSEPKKSSFSNKTDFARKGEDDFFGAVLLYPEFEPFVTAYAKKIVLHNQNDYIIYESNDRYVCPKGAEVLAASAFLNDENEELLLKYLAPLPPDSLDRTFSSVFAAMRRVWKIGGKIPHLPKVFEKYPELGREFN
ncbi:MAG: hypothetical protein E6767_10070 [Dysgonomonas sp.]|nr:hypothetical protein [Dysgonomonas sp.]